MYAAECADTIPYFNIEDLPLQSREAVINNELKYIERVSQFTFLGIVLDESLSWKNHITMIISKLSRINGVLHRLNLFFQKNILLTIYKSLFVTHINYGSLVWGNNFEAISKLQKRAIRTIAVFIRVRGHPLLICMRKRSPVTNLANQSV